MCSLYKSPWPSVSFLAWALKVTKNFEYAYPPDDQSGVSFMGCHLLNQMQCYTTFVLIV